MKTLLFSFTDDDGSEYGFDVRADKELSERIERAAKSGRRFNFDGTLDSRWPEWTHGTQLAPIWRLFSRIWNS